MNKKSTLLSNNTNQRFVCSTINRKVKGHSLNKSNANKSLNLTNTSTNNYSEHVLNTEIVDKAKLIPRPYPHPNAYSDTRKKILSPNTGKVADIEHKKSNQNIKQFYDSKDRRELKELKDIEIGNYPEQLSETAREKISVRKFYLTNVI